MDETSPTAVAILIDNSATSINGDFYPSRLQAQILTAVRYSQFLFSGNQNSQVAIGTLSHMEPGIRMSFTNSYQKIENSLNNITSSGNIDFLKGIKCALLALHHCNPNESLKKRILAFIGGENDITEKNAKYILTLLSKECVALDLVLLGNNISNKNVLEEIVSSIPINLHSNFLNVIHSNTVLSDDVLSSSIGPGQNSKVLLSEYAKKDPDLLAAIGMSKSTLSNQSPAISMMLQDYYQSNSPKCIENNAVTKKITTKIKKSFSKKVKSIKKLHTEPNKQTENFQSTKNSTIVDQKDPDHK